jgi:hypothetical protein
LDYDSGMKKDRSARSGQFVTAAFRRANPDSTVSETVTATRPGVIASISIEKPGAMKRRERGRIARWLRNQADWLEIDGADYTATGSFRARLSRPKVASS